MSDRVAGKDYSSWTLLYRIFKDGRPNEHVNIAPDPPKGADPKSMELKMAIEIADDELNPHYVVYAKHFPVVLLN